MNSQQKSGQSNSLSVDDVSIEGLSTVLSIIAQAETALQCKQQEVQVGHCKIKIDYMFNSCL